MYSYSLSPALSVTVRGVLLGVFLVLMLVLFMGYLPISEYSIPEYLVYVGLVSSSAKDLVNYSILITVFIVSLVLAVRGYGFYMGLIRFLALSTAFLALISVFVLIYTIYYEYVNMIDYSDEVYGFSFSLVLAIASVLLITKYPVIAIGFYGVDELGNIKPIGFGVEDIRLRGNEVLRVVVYGDHANLAVKPVPPENARIEDVGKTLKYSYIDVKISSSFSGYLEVYYNDKLVYRLRMSLVDVEYRDIVFKVFLNEDSVGKYSVRVESNKKIIEAAKPVIEAVLARIGIDREAVKEVQFFTEEGVYIPRETVISKLSGIDRVVTKIYFTEKYLEVLKYLRNKDVYELWDMLIERLEFIRRESPVITGTLEKLAKRVESVLNRWW
ncbi:MAG: hypothetical protein ABWW65_03090 [Thermoprotei archaeon]